MTGVFRQLVHDLGGRFAAAGKEAVTSTAPRIENTVIPEIASTEVREFAPLLDEVAIAMQRQQQGAWQQLEQRLSGLLNPQDRVQLAQRAKSKITRTAKRFKEAPPDNVADIVKAVQKDLGIADDMMPTLTRDAGDSLLVRLQAKGQYRPGAHELYVRPGTIPEQFPDMAQAFGRLPKPLQNFLNNARALKPELVENISAHEMRHAKTGLAYRNMSRDEVNAALDKLMKDLNITEPGFKNLLLDALELPMPRVSGVAAGQLGKAEEALESIARGSLESITKGNMFTPSGIKAYMHTADEILGRRYGAIFQHRHAVTAVRNGTATAAQRAQVKNMLTELRMNSLMEQINILRAQGGASAEALAAIEKEILNLSRLPGMSATMTGRMVAKQHQAEKIIKALDPLVARIRKMRGREPMTMEEFYQQFASAMASMRSGA